MMYERLIWLVPLAVAALGMWRPRAGLVVFAAALPFFGSPPGGPYLAALDAAAIAAIATAWRGGRAKPSPLAWPAAAFVAIGLVSLVPSPFQPPGWQPATLVDLLRAFPGVPTWLPFYTWRAAADLVLGWGLFLAVRRAFAGRSVVPLARSFLIGLTAVLVLGLASATGLVDLGGFRPYTMARLHSVFFLSGWLSEYLVLALPPAIAALLTTGRWGRRLAPLLAAVALGCLALTLQRGAWITVVAQLVFLAAVLARRLRGQRRLLSRALLRGGAALALTAVVVVAVGAPGETVANRARSLESGFALRTPLWSAATEMARQRPLLGWGLGSFSPAYDRVRPPGTTERLAGRNSAHSLYFQVAAECGLLGLLALGLLAWGAAVCLARPREGSRSVSLALATALAGALVYGLVQNLFHLRSIAWVLWLLLAAAAVTARDPAPGGGGRLGRALVVLAALLVPLRAFFAEPPDFAMNRSFGVHETEVGAGGPYRWTEGASARRIPWAGETLILELANGHPQAAGRPVEVTIRVDGVTAKRLTVNGGWERHAIEVGAPRRDSIVLGLKVQPTFRPFSDYRRYPELSASRDLRLLGVAMREPTWE